MPGLVDTHIHASQYSYAGTALDMPLLQWLNTYTFPVESRFKDLDFANRVYSQVVVSSLASWNKGPLQFVQSNLYRQGTKTGLYVSSRKSGQFSAVPSIVTQSIWFEKGVNS